MDFALIALMLITKWNVGVAAPDFYWKDYENGILPCDAFEGAPGRYIGLITNHAHYLPGTIYPEHKIAVTEFNGRLASQDYYNRVFCTQDKSKFYWQFVDFDKPLANQLDDAVSGGYEISHRPVVDLYIGKKIHEEEWKISKVVAVENAGYRGIWLWDKNLKPRNFRQFYLLKYNSTGASNINCATD